MPFPISWFTLKNGTVPKILYPNLRIIYTSNPKYAANIARVYNLPEDLVTWLAGPREKEIISYLKKPIRKRVKNSLKP
ncbi:MAG: hypothetical protein QXM43_05465 [Desulfurococcaceae archaeon]